MVAVFIVSRHWERRGHGGLSKETDFSVHINRFLLRRFSTHGSMEEGYWGSSAESAAIEYANQLATSLGAKVYRAKYRERAKA